MFNKLKAISAIVIATYASPSLALGVGSIEMKSTMNEPLDASIQLYGTETMSTGQLIARMGSMQDFERAGVIREYFLDDVRFSVELDNQGGGVIRLRTDNPVAEPYLNFVLDLRWPDGRILREYTALIDFMPLDSAPAVSPAESQSDEAQIETDNNNVTGRYRVASGDTLWDIALEVRPNRALSPQQTMRALVDNNPNAFRRGNINDLRAGALLEIPSEAQIAAVDGEQARRWVRQQNSQWSSPKTTLPASMPAPEQSVANEQEAASEGAYLRLARSDGDDAVGLTIDDASTSDAAMIRLEPVEANVAKDRFEEAPSSQRLATTLEDLDRSERQNEELTARLAALEEQVKTMQRLMALKDQQLAKMQSSPRDDELSLKSPTVLGGIGALLLAAFGWLVWSRRQPKDADPGVMPSPVFAMPDKEQPPIESGSEEQLPQEPVMNEVTAPVETIEQESNEDSSVPVQSFDAGMAMGEAPVAASTEPLQEPENPVADALTEVDIYLAYGRATKALELMRSVYSQNMSNEKVQLKLLEVAAAAGMAAEFADLYSTLKTSSDESILTGVAALEREYSAPVDEPVSGQISADEEPSADEKPSSSEVSLDPEEEHLDWDISADMEALNDPEAEGSPQQEDESLAQSEPLEGIDDSALAAMDEAESLDLDEDAIHNLELDDSAFLEEAGHEVVEDLPELDLDENALEADNTLPESDELVDLDDTSEEVALDDLEDFDLDSLNELADEEGVDDDDGVLDLDSLSLEDGDDLSLDDIMASALDEDDADSLLDDTDAISTKLDMARAYIEMGEHHSAIEILDEVISDGSEEQQAEAATLKGTLS